MKRQDYISWDEYFMGIALLSAQRSKDSHTQVGACIVNHENNYRLGITVCRRGVAITISLGKETAKTM